MMQTLKIPLKSKTTDGSKRSQRYEREQGGGCCRDRGNPWEVWGGVRKATTVVGTASARADATLTSLLCDTQGMAGLVRRAGLGKQSGSWRYLGWGGLKGELT